MGENKLILIGINEEKLEVGDEVVTDGAKTLNHEEVAHGISSLEGNDEMKGKNAADHLNYFGVDVGNSSPSDADVQKLQKFIESKARQQYDEIDNIIKKDEKND